MPHSLQPRPAQDVRRRPFATPHPITASAWVLEHPMRHDDEQVPATSLLFVPFGPPPEAGWPLLAWVHGTTTGGAPDRAPSLSETLDGGLTGDGYVTDYVDAIDRMLRSGFAVVAPDLEGLGPTAATPHPYYGADSLARSVNGAVRAARDVEPSLARAWGVIGHSEGGHGSLATESLAHELPDADLVGTVAFAPFTSVTAIVDYHGDQAIRHPEEAFDHVVQQNFNVALIAAGLRALDDGFDFGSVMGVDLAAVMPTLTATGSVGIVSAIADSITRASIRDFRGLRPGWDLVPTVRRFLERNDLAIMPRFRPERPTLILQGDVDVSVPEPITRAFLHNLGPRAQNIAYRCYPGVDHFQIVREGLPAALEFLHHHFDAQR
ncbi:lipase family protein [Cnuibacter sp. UC19_7]|uniref:lipase family protein n=1 Tax=Cnuibacter sp. UC19_7 TaxID=3350166 RepID=UPI00366F6C2E